MTQFIVMMLGLGVAVPTLHERGVNSIVLSIGAAVGLVGVHLLIGAIGRLLPVRCRHCGGHSTFRGFGWWPFIYRYACQQCEQEMRFEVTG